MSLRRRLIGVYRRIFHTYRAWSPQILLLALLIFVPLGLLDAVSLHVDLDSLDPGEGIRIAAAFLAATAIATTGLLGEIFFSGAIAISLTHAGDRPPPLREIARRIKYGRLIVVDLAFVAIVAVGLLLGFFPGLLAFVYLSLAGPAIEIEDHSAAGALRRSVQLVRGSFWFVFWVLAPIELVGDAIGAALAALVHGLLGESFFAQWMAESLSNVALSPLFAVSAVLLAVELIVARDGPGPTLHHQPAAR